MQEPLGVAKVEPTEQLEHVALDEWERQAGGLAVVDQTLQILHINSVSVKPFTKSILFHIMKLGEILIAPPPPISLQ